jgi:hypothetical protein
LFDSDSPGHRIVVYHFNVPVQRTQDPAAFDTIRRQVETDFPVADRGRVVVPPYFQISAVYILVHRDTGEERLWQGSFNPRSRDLGQVTVFRPFDPPTFVQYALNRASTDNVLHQLRNRPQGQESVWSVDRILSVIVSVQATVRISHVVFTNHPELLRRGRDEHHEAGAAAAAQQPPPARRLRRGGAGAVKTRHRAVFRMDLE